MDRERVLGVRTPLLRKYAKEIAGSIEATEFLHELPHTFYEENNLHAFLIERIPDYDTCIREINQFLPYVDNWATCDSMRPRCFKKNLDALMHEIERWIASNHEYTVRFGIEALMVYYTDGAFRREHLTKVARIESDAYYVNMMIAWYFATRLSDEWNETISYIEQNRLSKWTHNVTIQKAIESYRIDSAQKTYLRSLKRET